MNRKFLILLFVTIIIVGLSSILLFSESYSPNSSYAFNNSSSSTSNNAISVNTTFSEYGLPHGYTWYVTYGGNQQSAATPDALSFSTISGTYSYLINTLDNSTESCTTTYSPYPSLGNLIAGSSQSITFTGTTHCNSITTTFLESGLPPGTSWTVDYGSLYNSTASSAITFSSSQNTYAYSISTISIENCEYTPSPESGGLAAGSSQNVYYSGNCSTTFTPSGPSGLSSESWSVTYGASEKSANGDTQIIFYAAPGNYQFSVPSIGPICYPLGGCGDYVPSPSSGSLPAGNSETIDFSYRGGGV